MEELKNAEEQAMSAVTVAVEPDPAETQLEQEINALLVTELQREFRSSEFGRLCQIYRDHEKIEEIVRASLQSVGYKPRP